MTIPRKFADGRAHFDADNLSPNTTFQFRVRDSARGTVTVYLDNTLGHQFGIAKVGSDGTFEAKFTMPNGFGNQPHSIFAVEVANGQTTEASTSVFVAQIIR